MLIVFIFITIPTCFHTHISSLRVWPYLLMVAIRDKVRWILRLSYFWFLLVFLIHCRCVGCDSCFLDPASLYGCFLPSTSFIVFTYCWFTVIVLPAVPGLLTSLISPSSSLFSCLFLPANSPLQPILINELVFLISIALSPSFLLANILFPAVRTFLASPIFFKCKTRHKAVFFWR